MLFSYWHCIDIGKFFFQYLALLKDNINRPQRARCILWAVGQAGLSDLGNGLKGKCFSTVDKFLCIRVYQTVLYQLGLGFLLILKVKLSRYCY